MPSPLWISENRPYPPRRRVFVSGALGHGISKRRSIVKRSFANSANSSNAAAAVSEKGSKKSPVTWREALKSPRKAITYAGQLRRALVDWAKHMWAGVKLLAADVRVSSRIMKRITHGKQITRRERNFIVKTGVDLARLVPFSLFLIIPLAEFALPFALRLFPNMLPSQFQDQMKQEEDMKRSLKGRLELAKYLRDVVEEKAKTIKASDTNSELKRNAEDLTEFLEAIRSGKDVDEADVSRFAKLFNDELTIDGAVRPQLVAMCKYMGLSPYGHDQFLRFKLRSRLNAIKKDDMQIMWEGGADSLTDEEVRKACRDRGIREGVSYTRMRQQLAAWLDLSQNKEIPGSLLILSRAFLYTGADPSSATSEENLVETLGSLSDDVIMDAKQAADVSDGNNVDRLEETLRQAKLIEIESEREARKEKEDEEKRKKKDADEEAELIDDRKDSFPDETISDREVLEKVQQQETEIAQEVIGEVKSAEMEKLESARDVPVEAEPESKDEEQVEKERDVVRGMLLSMGELASNSAVEREREEVRRLKTELAEAEQFVKETEGSEGSDLRRFKSMVSKLEREIERVDAKVGLRMKLLDKDNDGLMSLDECKQAMTVIAGDPDDEVMAATLKRLDADADGNFSKADLERVLHEMHFEFGVVDDDTPKQTEVVKETLKEAQSKVSE